MWVCAFVCVFCMRGNGRKNLVYRINIDTNQARVQLIYERNGSSADLNTMFTAHWMWMQLLKLVTNKVTTSEKPENTLLAKKLNCCLWMSGAADLTRVLLEGKDRSWVSSCEEEAKEEEQGRLYRTDVWQEELQKACREEGVIFALKWIRVALSRCCSTRGTHSHPRW